MTDTNETPAPDTGQATPPARKPIPFEKVEALRKHMLLTVENMADLFGVSRVTYYSWLRGKYPRKKKEEQVRSTIRRLFYCISNRNWPTPEVLVADQPDRFKMLTDLLAELDQTPTQG